MITDIETNKVYFSSLIKTEKYQQFWTDLEKILKKHDIHYDFIEGTRDIWCRDYMPVQINDTEFVQFKYFPNYCLDYDNIKTLTIQEELRYDLPADAEKKYMDLIVDGGNIVKSKNRAILTKKVIDENDNREDKTVINWLKKALKVDELHFIPIQPYDYTGHADGMVRFLDDDTLLINDYSKTEESKSWQDRFDTAIRKTGIDTIPFPYAHGEKNDDGDYTADGCYINFAQIGNIILFPQFGINKDGEALAKIHELYPEPEFHIEPIDAKIVAERGGVLNCMTWNVYKHMIESAIDSILPVFGSKEHMLVIHRDESKPIKDTICIELYPEKGVIAGAWSLQKLIKRVEPIIEIGEHEILDYQAVLSKNFSTEQLSDILKQLAFPNKEVFDELVNIPERLKDYRPE